MVQWLGSYLVSWGAYCKGYTNPVLEAPRRWISGAAHTSCDIAVVTTSQVVGGHDSHLFDVHQMVAN